VTDVFISYAKVNAPAVRQLADAVKRLGYSVWWDDELPPHLSYSDVITDKIGAARAAIVVWSKDAAASQWVRAEADVARAQKKLIQTSIDGRMPPMPFNQIQFAAIGDWRGEEDYPGWVKVKASLVALVGPAAPGADAIIHPMPATPPPAAAPAAPHKWHGLLIGVSAAAALFVAGAALFAWLRGGAPATQVPTPPQTGRPVEQAKPVGEAFDKPPSSTTPATHRSRPATTSEAPPGARAKPAGQPASTNLRGGWRYCLGPGRGTPECAELRARYGRRR
jgi:hypothetical protein